MSGGDLRIGGKLRPINEMPEYGLELSLGERWFVAQTLHHREKLAALHLGAQRFRSFLPRFRKTVRHARRLREVVAPVFPGYIFLILDPERDRWRSINGTFGVARLVSAHGRPVSVPSGTVEAMIAAMDQSGLVRLGGELTPGQAVRVVAGPLLADWAYSSVSTERGAFGFYCKSWGARRPSLWIEPLCRRFDPARRPRTPGRSPRDAPAAVNLALRPDLNNKPDVEQLSTLGWRRL